MTLLLDFERTQQLKRVLIFIKALFDLFCLIKTRSLNVNENLNVKIIIRNGTYALHILRNNDKHFQER